MTSTSEIVIERVAAVRGEGESILSLAAAAVEKLSPASGEIGGVIAATFSNPDRFPALAVRIAAQLGLSTDAPAFDVQMACSAYPYAVYLAGKLAADTGRRVLVVDGDVQSRLVDHDDHATGDIFSDAATASIVSTGDGESSRVGFLTRLDDALTCAESGPIRMDGMRVFTFVATEVAGFLRGFGSDFDWFVPHQANPYMIRQLAKTLGLDDKLLTLDPSVKNPGSCSVPMTLAGHRPGGRALIAGFGAGLSAAAAVVTLRPQ